jgi:hypothetical protein
MLGQTWATADKGGGVDVEEILLAEAFRDAWPQGRPCTWDSDAPGKDEVEADRQRQEGGGNGNEDDQEEDPNAVYDPEEDNVEEKEAWEEREMDNAV